MIITEDKCPHCKRINRYQLMVGQVLAGIVHCEKCKKWHALAADTYQERKK